ncbi:MAG: Ribosomal RNA small subunit methyltransferase I [Firmicutes bacterium ADurb.Bin182]|nr:MAG: Ribosomal RNA small subunit methyltransferase I [Firmicutes bacterium ADurb.Bin182]
MAGTLYIVATPIGNGEDITERAKRILAEAHIVAAEDTRTTQKLFNMLGIRNKMVSNHKFNEKKQSDYLVSELLKGKDVAIVSDAGTPCISDPGHIIVNSAIINGIKVVGVPGASSAITALSISGFNFVSFAFYGFFPRESEEIRESLKRLKVSGIGVSVFFESPKRIIKLMRIMAEELPDAKLCLCNDMTKIHEKIYRGTAFEVLRELEENPNADKGEYTLVIKTEIEEVLNAEERQSIESVLVDHIVKNGGTVKSAVQALQKKYKGQITRKEFYAAALNLKELMPAFFLSDTGGPDEGEIK